MKALNLFSILDKFVKQVNMERVSNIFDVANILDFISNHRIAVATSTAAVLYGAWFLKRPRNVPPGPYGYPFVGSLFSFNSTGISNLRKKYGDVICLWLGGNNYCVLLNSYEAIKELYITRGDEFMDRANGDVPEALTIDDTMFNSPYNASYKLSRKIASQGFRSLFKSKLEPVMEAELLQIEENIKKNHGKPIQLDLHYGRAMTNTILMMLFDKSYKHDDKELDDFISNLQFWFQETIGLGEMEMFSGILKLMVKLFTYKKLKKTIEHTKMLVSMVKDHLQYHIATYDKNNIRDLLDAYLEADGLAKIGAEKVCGTMMVFLPDAIHTASAMMMWCFIYAINYPEWQDAIFAEIKSQKTSSRVSITERSIMPITESFIMEVMRCSKIVVFGMVNRPVRDTVFRGYNMFHSIPVIPNLAASLNDPNLFPEPNIFIPTRFIKDGKIVSAEGFIPFGMGRRMCVGEPLIRNEIFYYFANMILHYKIRSADEEHPSTMPRTGDYIFNLPCKFKVILEERPQ